MTSEFSTPLSQMTACVSTLFETSTRPLMSSAWSLAARKPRQQISSQEFPCWEIPKKLPRRKSTNLHCKISCLIRVIFQLIQRCLMRILRCLSWVFLWTRKLSLSTGKIWLQFGTKLKATLSNESTDATTVQWPLTRKQLLVATPPSIILTRAPITSTDRSLSRTDRSNANDRSSTRISRPQTFYKYFLFNFALIKNATIYKENYVSQ